LTAKPLGDDGQRIMASREEHGMNRDELAALPDAIDMVLTLPDVVRDQADRWFTPQAAKPGNAHDPHRRRSRRWKRLQKRRGFRRRRPKCGN
jgi:hypothetical protein